VDKYLAFRAKFEASKILQEQEESKQEESKDEEVKDESPPSS